MNHSTNTPAATAAGPAAASLTPRSGRFYLRSICRAADRAKFLATIVLENHDGLRLDRKSDVTIELVCTARQLETFAAFRRVTLEVHALWLRHPLAETGGRYGREVWAADVADAFARATP
jgi:hypothetical protein